MDTSADRTADEIEDAQMNEALANELRGWRGKRRMSLEALADASGISKRTLIRLEAGEANFSIGHLRRLARVFDIKVSTIVNAAETEIGIE